MGAHLNYLGQFQSDKYPTCPPGKVPLSVKDPTAQDLLWEYAQRRRSVDAEFSADLECALRKAGFVPPSASLQIGDTVQHKGTGRTGQITAVTRDGRFWVGPTGPYSPDEFVVLRPGTAAPPACRRCTECVGQEHHWLQADHDPETDRAFVPCKHCDAEAQLCEECFDAPVWPIVSDAPICVDCRMDQE